MTEYDSYYKCSNKKCKIQMDKCPRQLPKQSLYPARKRFWTPKKVQVLEFLAIMAVIVAFLGFLGMGDVRLGGF
jgi:hypothetical protein